jgi:competence protein ComEA
LDPAGPTRRFSQTYAARAGAIVLVVVSSILVFNAFRPRASEPPLALGSITHRVDLNSAGAEELALLPNIGPKLARAIIEDRETNGDYETLEDLDRVRGIGPRTIEDLIGYVVQEPIRP